MGSSFQSPQKKFQRYRPINDIMRTIFVIGFMIMGKELLADLNLAIFKIWLDTLPKMEMHDPNVYPTILGGVWRGFWSPSSKCQKMALRGPKSRTDSKTLAKHPQKWWAKYLGYVFSFLGKYQANFEKNAYFVSFWSRFSPIG